MFLGMGTLGEAFDTLEARTRTDSNYSIIEATGSLPLIFSAMRKYVCKLLNEPEDVQLHYNEESILYMWIELILRRYCKSVDAGHPIDLNFEGDFEELLELHIRKKHEA